MPTRRSILPGLFAMAALPASSVRTGPAPPQAVAACGPSCEVEVVRRDVRLHAVDLGPDQADSQDGSQPAFRCPFCGRGMRRGLGETAAIAG